MVGTISGSVPEISTSPRWAAYRSRPSPGAATPARIVGQLRSEAVDSCTDWVIAANAAPCGVWLNPAKGFHSPPRGPSVVPIGTSIPPTVTHRLICGGSVIDAVVSVVSDPPQLTAIRATATTAA